MRHKKTEEQQSLFDFDGTPLVVQRPPLSISTRFIMTPLPVQDSDVGGDGTSYQRDFPHSSFRRTLYLTSTYPEPRRREALNQRNEFLLSKGRKTIDRLCWIPSGSIGRDIQAILLSESLKAKEENRRVQGGYVVTFESMKAVCERIQIEVHPNNYSRVDDMLRRFENLMIQYFENGQDVTMKGVSSEQAHKILVAKNYARINQGNRRGVSIVVDPEFLFAFGTSVQKVAEAAFFALQSPFEKDFYSWARYAAEYARRSEGVFTSPLGQIVAQLAGSKDGNQAKLTRNNRTHFKASVENAIKRLRELDRSFSVEFSQDTLDIRVRPEESTPKGGIPAPVMTTATAGSHLPDVSEEDRLSEAMLEEMGRSVGVNPERMSRTYANNKVG